MKKILNKKWIAVIGAVIITAGIIGSFVGYKYYRQNLRYVCEAVYVYPYRLTAYFKNTNETKTCKKVKNYILCPVMQKNIANYPVTSYFGVNTETLIAYVMIGSQALNNKFGQLMCVFTEGDADNSIGDNIFCVIRKKPFKCKKELF